MRTVRSSRRHARPGRPTRSSILAAAGGGGGGGYDLSGLPARTTVPTFRESDSDTPSTSGIAFDLSAGGQVGDLAVCMGGVTSLASFTSIAWATMTNVDEVSGSGLGTTFSHHWQLTPGYLTLDAAPDTITPTWSGGSNMTPTHQRAIFTTGTWSGTPTLVFAEAVDSFPSAGGITAPDANTIKFPDLEIPTGYVAVYCVNHGSTGTNVVWTQASERLDAQSFAGTDSRTTQGTLSGPVTANNVTVSRSGLVAVLEQRGMFAAVWVVPGT